MKAFKRLAALTFLLIMLAPLTGCNTLEGAGKAIEAAGEKIQDVVD